MISFICFFLLFFNAARSIYPPQELSWYSFEPQSNAQDLIVDSIGGLNGTREGSSNGTALVRFLNSTSGFCKFGACITFWAFSAASTQNSVGRLVLPGRVDFPTFGGAIAFWMYMETEILHNARLVSKFLPDGTTNTATNSLFQVSLLELPFNRTGSLSNRTTITALGEEYNFFVFRFHMQFTTSVEAGAQPVTGDRGLFEFQTHPFKQQWQHIVISFSQTGLKLFRDGKLLETIDAKFGTYARNDSLPVVVGNSAAFNRAPAARLDELRFFGYTGTDQEITEDTLMPVLLNLPSITTSSSTQGFSSRSVFTRMTPVGASRSFTSVTKAIPTANPGTESGALPATVNDSIVTSALSGVEESSGGVMTNDAPIIEEPEGRGKGAVIGGVIGGVLVAILLIGLLIWWTLRDKHNRNEQLNSGFINTPPLPAETDNIYAKPPANLQPTPAAAATTVVGIYDHVPTQASVISQQPLRNIYTKAPRSGGTQESIATYGAAPDPSAFDVRSPAPDQVNGYTRAPSANLLYS
jgi:hypothetical protein